MKMNYVEPKEYFTPSARKILEEGETKSAKKTDKKPSTQAAKRSKKKRK